MSEHFIFIYVADRRFLTLRLTGLWNEAVLQQFVAEAVALRDRVEKAGHRDDRGCILLDLTEFPVQPKAITESLAQLLPRFGDRTGRVAVARSASALQHLQMQRILTSAKVRIFATVREAQTWLSEPQDASSAASRSA